MIILQKAFAMEKYPVSKRDRDYHNNPTLSSSPSTAEPIGVCLRTRKKTNQGVGSSYRSSPHIKKEKTIIINKFKF